MKTSFVLLVYMQVVVCAVASADSFSIAGIQASPGETVSGYLEVAPLNDSGTRIPLTIIHGAESGPTLALIAGVHGYEYAPILALHRLRGEIDPSKLFGIVVMVHIANLPGFQGRGIYLSPEDKKNLNRVFPGDPVGTLSERIAQQITEHVIEQSDYVIDMHAGDGNEALRPFTYLPVTGKKSLDQKSRQLAVAFGLDHIVLDRATVTSPDESGYVDMTAISRGIPAITTETGQLGSTESAWVTLAHRGVNNVLRSLDMLAGKPDTPGEIVWLEDYTVLRSQHDGVFEHRVKDGYFVAEGTTIGTLRNYFGEKIDDITAPFAGVVNYVVATPPVNKGEPLAMISRVATEE